MDAAAVVQDNTLTLGPNLDIAHAGEIRTALQQLLQQEGALCLDAGDVARCDAAGLQLLLAFTRHCRSQGRELRWNRASDLLCQDVVGLGLASELAINPQAQGGTQ